MKLKKVIPGILLALLISSCNNENRYELVMESKNWPSIMLVDKQTGAIWVNFGDGKQWKHLGTPPKDAPNKGDLYQVE